MDLEGALVGNTGGDGYWIFTGCDPRNFKKDLDSNGTGFLNETDFYRIRILNEFRNCANSC